MPSYAMIVSIRGIPPVAASALVYQWFPAVTSRALRDCSHMEHTQGPTDCIDRGCAPVPAGREIDHG